MQSPIITSILDTDLYKLSMQQCVLFGKTLGKAYDSIDVEYEFMNRGKTPFPDHFAKGLRYQVDAFADLRLSSEQQSFLAAKCPYLRRSYLDFLAGYRFNPKQVSIEQHGSDLFVSVKGPWYSTILWEVPLMAVISELYFAKMEMRNGIGPLFANSCCRDKTKEKAKTLNSSHISVADFGTRRRYSREVHHSVVEILSQGARTNFVGSSNLQLCMEYNLLPVGTNAHEFYQAHGALFGYTNANYYAMEAWLNEFDGSLGHALTDTFTTDVFLKNFHLKHAKLFDGLRQDSGDPYIFTDKVVNKYRSLRIDPSTKTIIFSDGLDIPKAVQIGAYCNHRNIRCSAGIGTNLTNDIDGVTPLNIVIKMTKCDGQYTVKLSDVPGKKNGHPDAVELCQKSLEIG